MSDKKYKFGGTRASKLSNEKIVATQEQKDFIYNCARRGNEQQDIYKALGWSHNLWYSILKRDSEVYDAYTRGSGEYHTNLMHTLDQKQRDSDNPSFINLSLTYAARAKGKHADYSDETANIISSKDTSTTDKIIAVLKDHASKRLSIKKMNDIVDGLVKLDNAKKNEDMQKKIDQLTTLVETLQDKVDNR